MGDPILWEYDELVCASSEPSQGSVSRAKTGTRKARNNTIDYCTILAITYLKSKVQGTCFGSRQFPCKDMQPMSSVEVVEPRFTVPSRKYFSKTLLPEMYKTEKQRVKMEFGDGKPLIVS